MLKTVALAIRFFWRDWRAGEWYVLFLALMIAVAAISTLHFYIDRLTRGFNEQSAKFLGGNLVVSSATPIPAAWQQQADALHLKTSQVWTYPSVASAKDKLELVTVQAVSDNYPLLSVDKVLPTMGKVWVDSRLLALLAIHLNDPITIGAANFPSEKTLSNMTGTLTTSWSLAPLVYMRLSDVPRTRTVIPGSRVDYRFLVAGEANDIQQFRKWVLSKLTPSQQVIDINNQQFGLRDTLQQAENYFQLILLVCILMSATAIAMTVQHYLRRHYAHVALWRCLGAREKQIFQLLAFQLLLVGILAGAVGLLLGYAAQEILVSTFKNLIQFTLPPPSRSPIILGYFTCLLLLSAFAYPVVSDLPRISPLYIWRNEIPTSQQGTLGQILAMLALLAFIAVFMDFSLLTLFFIDAILMMIGFAYALSLFVLYLLKYVAAMTNGSLRRGLSQLLQHPESAGIQYVGFSLILLFLVVLAQVRTELLNSWRQSLPEKTPNYFAINLAPLDVPPFKQVLLKNQVNVEGIYPIVRGRLIELNDKPIVEAVPNEARGNNALHRELNLSWMWQFPSDNEVVQGEAWSKRDIGKHLISIENKLAHTLQLHLGDKLTFQLGDKKFSGVIKNFRTVKWSSFHPNFFIIFPPGLLESYPTTYITSFHLLANQAQLLNQLTQQFPNITILDIAKLLEQVQGMVTKISQAIQYLFVFALVAGVLIFIASLQASLDQRRKSYRLLRILGASNHFIRKSILVEFSALALLIGLTVIIFAQVMGYFLIRNLFNF